MNVFIIKRALAVLGWPPALAGGVAAWIMTKERHGTP